MICKPVPSLKEFSPIEDRDTMEEDFEKSYWRQISLQTDATSGDASSLFPHSGLVSHHVVDGCTCFDYCKPCTELIDMIACEVAEHYKVSACLVALQCQCQQMPRGKPQDLCIVSCVGSVDASQLPLSPKADSNNFKMFHYNVARALPIIIEDAKEDPRLKDHPLVVNDQYGIRFYASAPLVVRLDELRNVYIGTMCILDKRPRGEFSLADSEMLMQQASDVATVLGGQLQNVL